MPPQDWNIAGRAGRVDQGDLGIVALAAQDDAKQVLLEKFIDESVAELNSTLVDMVKAVANTGALLRLESLSHQPGWSAFVQYLAHTYRQIDNHWSPELFAGRRDDLRRMMGLLLQVPELREPLEDVTGGTGPDGDKLARIICDWVQGRPLTEMATEYFSQPVEEESDEATTDPVAAMTQCCRSVFGRLTQTASWGLSALQSLTLGSSIDELSPDEHRSLRNLPARVYYGVNTDEAVALRLLGVPRTAASALAKELAVKAGEPLHQVRTRLRTATVTEWTRAMGELGASYHRVWCIMEGTDV